MQFSAKNWKIIALLGVGAPPWGKSWIRHCPSQCWFPWWSVGLNVFWAGFGLLTRTPGDGSYSNTNWICNLKQECVPVGCVLPAHWPYLVVSARGVCMPCMPPCHTRPLPYTPPTMHAPYHAPPITHTPLATHATLQCMSPLPHMPPTMHPSPVDRQTPVET